MSNYKDPLFSLTEKVSVIPLMSVEEPLGDIKESDRPLILPLLALRNAVLFPGTLMPIPVVRQKSAKLIKEVFSKNRLLGTVTQIEASKEDPEEKDISRYGCLARILKVIEMPDDGITVILHGLSRFCIDRLVQKEPYFAAEVKYLQEVLPVNKDAYFKTLLSGIKDAAIQIFSSSPGVPKEAEYSLRSIDDGAFLVNFVASNVNLDNPIDKLPLLEEDNLTTRASKLLELLYKELELLKIKESIQQKVRGEMDQQQKEYYLNNQLKTIQDELGISGDMEEIEDLRRKAKDKQWNKETADYFLKEVNKLERTNPNAPDYNIQLNYLQFMVELPWNHLSQDNMDLAKAQKVLDKDHYGLEKVKERIVEHLAVLKLRGDLKSPILCLYGPPGVGKTSLGQSVATALKRKFARISLGGMHDESEIRGHRRTYIGAMPGRILQSIKRCGTSNPVIILDEIDKVGADFRGDPSSALLEVLDPEQNNSFHDNYLDLDYDLSKVLFITTANNVEKIPSALRDRMEMIPVSGYLAEEKHQIAVRHLIPKELKAHGLKKADVRFGTEAVDTIINEYTRESGVRILDRQIAKIMRKIARHIALEETYNHTLKSADIRSILGLQTAQHDMQKGNEFAGVATGLAWTEAGGEILFIESSVCKGKGILTTTGNLGDVMKESAVLSLQYLKSHPELASLQPEVFEEKDLHLHVPEGAIPKDGPSAGIAIICSMASALSGKALRHGIALTGEITLRGKVLPVGGIKEKILAAKRSGIHTIILSDENRKDVEDINQLYIKGLDFIYVHSIPEVIENAF